MHAWATRHLGDEWRMVGANVSSGCSAELFFAFLHSTVECPTNLKLVKDAIYILLFAHLDEIDDLPRSATQGIPCGEGIFRHRVNYVRANEVIILSLTSFMPLHAVIS